MPPWPPPPDLVSIKELFAAADVEGLIADECPLDEYDPEAKHFFDETMGWPTHAFVVERTLPLLERLWTKQFTLDEAQLAQRRPALLALAQRRPALLALAQQIARFFGPEVQPQIRNQSPA